MTNDLLKLLKSIHSEIVRSNDMREALSPVDSATLAMRIEQIRSRREEAESRQRDLEAAAAAVAADEKGSLAFPAESAAAIKVSTVLTKAAAGNVADDVLPQNAKEPAGETNGPFPVSGPGPDLRSARAVLVVSNNIVTAATVTAGWNRSMVRREPLVIDSKELRDKYTKDVRSDPHTFFSLAGNVLLFVCGDMDMRPESWIPAFDVIVVVSGDTYTLLKGHRAAVKAAAPTAPVVSTQTAVATPRQVDHAENTIKLPSVNRILKSSLPDIARHKAVMFYGPDLRLTKFLVECIVYNLGAPTIPVEFVTEDEYKEWKARSIGETDPYRSRAAASGYQVHVIVGWDSIVDRDYVDVCILVKMSQKSAIRWEIQYAVKSPARLGCFLEVGPA